MSRGAITLKEAGLAEIDEIMAVMSDSFDPSYGEAWTAPQCSGLLPMPGVWLTLARDAAQPVGFALCRVVADEAELLLLAVKRKDQRRGIGKLLLDRFAAIAKNRGAVRLHLEVREGNQAVNLYSSAGYTVVGRRNNYYTGRDGQVYNALTLARTSSR